MSFFNKLFGNETLTSIEKLKVETEKGFEKIAQQAIRKGSGDQLMGPMGAYHAIINAGKTFKRDFVVLAPSLKLSPSE